MIESVYQAKVGSLMNQIRAYQDRTDLINSDVGTQRVDQTNKSGFGDYIQTAVEAVNETQMNAAEMRDAYERGEDVPLTDVVLSMQKSSLAFEATLQVRNKLLKAYNDVLSMPV
ncbi:MAG TPA: flagellar hook-basal body complex protein FliE [Gammaproteobacteria bacterium]|jgi:flagellar hook-basal body complex protein FliE|nr:flagellar hook-basal body complex protein FliE [Gammaproteobacteria bacterium]|tara:strand:+ start:793 stop:1134 length:342 start_codon:yes stop_codon:yes gene_type:complete